MFDIIDKAGTGKTKKLLEECVETSGVFVTDAPSKIIVICATNGFKQPIIYTYNEYIDFLRNTPKGKRAPVYIDNIDAFLMYLDTNIAGYTKTED